MDSSDEKPKAYLVLTVLGGESVRIPVYKSPYTIGRAKSCNYIIPNKIISGQHCCVSHDEEKNRFFIEDTSTNGMLVNKKVRTTKGQKVCLKNGDEVYLVYRKQSASIKDVISFQFEEVQEEVSAIDLHSTLSSEDDEATQEYLADVTKSDEVGPAAADEHKKRKRESEDDQVSSGEQSKKPHIASVADVPVSVQAVSKDTEQIMDEELGVNPAGMVSDDKLETKSLEMKEEEARGGVPLPPKEKTEGEDAVEEPADEMMQTLICSICQDILHDCVSLQPCMHTFCAACYSQWMNKSGRCPTCRKRVKRLSKNHIVNNLVDAYLKTHPEKKRSQEDIDEMNASNKITADTVINPRLGEETYSDDSGNDLNSSSELDDSASFPIPAAQPWWTCINNVIGLPFLPTMTCRQCPGNPPSSVATSVTQGTAQPSTSAGPSGASSDLCIASGNVRVVLPTAPAFVCPPVATHLMCQCCQERFPDRRRESNQSNIPSVTCSICQMFYCHMYWGCSSNRGCFGCLSKLKDLNFGNKCTDRLILGNTEESSIFKNYLQQNNLTWKDVLNECMRQLDLREMSYHTLHVTTNNITKDSILCYTCGMKVFKELAYAYRASISHQMPAEVTSRPNCYWGSNCRTQFTKPQHAVRYNHVCHQTRF